MIRLFKSILVVAGLFICSCRFNDVTGDILYQKDLSQNHRAQKRFRQIDKELTIDWHNLIVPLSIRFNVGKDISGPMYISNLILRQHGYSAIQLESLSCSCDSVPPGFAGTGSIHIYAKLTVRKFLREYHYSGKILTFNKDGLIIKEPLDESKHL